MAIAEAQNMDLLYRRLVQFTSDCPQSLVFLSQLLQRSATKYGGGAKLTIFQLIVVDKKKIKFDPYSKVNWLNSVK